MNLTWKRFFVGLSIAVAPVLLLTAFGVAATGTTEMSNWVALLVLVSISAFFMYRWRKVQEAALAQGQQLESAIVVSPIKALLGPTFPAVLWFVVTFALLILLVVVSASAS